MVITDKYYPYPVLGGKAVAFSGDCMFGAKFNALSNSKKVVVEVTPELKEPTLESLVADGYARLVCHVECPATAYREVRDVKLGVCQKLDIPAGLVARRVQVNVVIVANAHLPQYRCESFVGIYKGRTFDVEHGGLLAVAETFSFDVDLKDSRISDARSPVQVCPDIDESAKFIRVNMDGEDIDVFVPPSQFKTYKAMDDGKSVSASGSRNHDLLIALVIVPALVEVMSTIAQSPLDSGTRDVGQFENCKWFAPINAIVADYLKGEGEKGDLATIDFENHPPLKLAQFIAGYPLASAFRRLEEM